MRFSYPMLSQFFISTKYVDSYFTKFQMSHSFNNFESVFRSQSYFFSSNKRFNVSSITRHEHVKLISKKVDSWIFSLFIKPMQKKRIECQHVVQDFFAVSLKKEFLYFIIQICHSQKSLLIVVFKRCRKCKIEMSFFLESN